LDAYTHVLRLVQYTMTSTGAEVDLPGELVNVKQHHLLAIDLGLKCGMALYGADGRLCSYRSQHYGSPAALKKAVTRILSDMEGLAWIVTEGDYTLAAIWERAAMKQGIRVQRVSAEVWREALLIPRERTCATEAKKNATALARRVIHWSDAPRPTSLRHDAAEAICVGLWAVERMGWLNTLPAEIRAPQVLARAGGIR
jgi:hypothetical protein